MSESLRKKIIFAALPLAIVWAFFTYPTEKETVVPESTVVVTPLTQIQVPSIVNQPVTGQIQIEEKQAERWGKDPFRTYTYRLTQPASGSKTLKWTLGGIIHNNNTPLAFINQKTVRVGDKIGNATVIAIDKASVTLDYRGRKIKLNLNKG